MDTNEARRELRRMSKAALWLHDELGRKDKDALARRDFIVRDSLENWDARVARLRAALTESEA